MAERENDYAEFDQTDQTDQIAGSEVARRRGPDLLALVVGVLTLAMAAAAFTGYLPELPHFDPRWLVAAAAAVVGTLLLLGSLRRR